jgi:hypothetical protein
VTGRSLGLQPAMLAHLRPNPREARGRASRLSVGPNGLSCEATKTDGSPMRRSNKAFKLTSASRVEALRATTRWWRSQLNAMFDGRHSMEVEPTE